jgi:hypothetical protein
MTDQNAVDGTAQATGATEPQATPGAEAGTAAVATPSGAADSAPHTPEATSDTAADPAGSTAGSGDAAPGAVTAKPGPAGGAAAAPSGDAGAAAGAAADTTADSTAAAGAAAGEDAAASDATNSAAAAGTAAGSSAAAGGAAAAGDEAAAGGSAAAAGEAAAGSAAAGEDAAAGAAGGAAGSVGEGVTPAVVAGVAAAGGVAAGDAAGAGEAAGAPVSAEADPGKWGRVDADGTVYVKTADGERAVGSWQAGDPAEGLAHFARRFDDLRTEVELLFTRLSSGAGDPKQAMTSAKHLVESVRDAAVVGDLVALEARVQQVVAKAELAMEAGKQAKEAARAEATARKQALAEEAEQIAAEATQWKVAGDRLRAILDEWKGIKGIDRKTDEQLWKRFAKARDTFNRRRGSHFADLDRQRSAAKTRKQELVDEAEQIADSDDWGPTAGRYKQLMIDWKAAGRASKESDDALWQRFRAAQDKFFSRRSSVFDERDAEFVENAKAKEALLAEAASIDPARDLEGARAALHRIQDQWDQIGKVPRERIRDLEGKLRAVEEKVKSAGDAQWRRTDPEAEARAAQFRERVEQFESQAAKARAAGDKRRAEQAESQAAQWREWLAAAEQAVASR